MTTIECRPDGGMPVRCSDWTQTNHVDPVGSAGRADTIVLVETPGPWPADIKTMPVFASELGRFTTVLATEVTVQDPERALVTIYRRRSLSELVGTDHLVGRSSLVDALPRLLSEDEFESGDPAPFDVLVCGHGRRDRCCGKLGVKLQMVAQTKWPAVRIRRSSHLGGHRFAPTCLTPHDGRMWAHMDETVLGAVIEGSWLGADARRYYRGSNALDPWEQSAEREIALHVGTSWVDCVLDDVHSEVDGDARWHVSMSWHGPHGNSRAVATVAAGRVVPTPVCGEPIEFATKSSREFSVVSLDVG